MTEPTATKQNHPQENIQETQDTKPSESNASSIPLPHSNMTSATVAPLKSSSEINPETLAQLENVKNDLATNLAKKKKLDKELANLEATLYAHETTYLTDPTANLFGNIVKGYEAYVKAPPSTNIGDHHSTRRKRAYTNFAAIGPSSNPTGTTEIVGDAERIFSKSSGSYVRALEIRSKEHESAVTSEQESIVPMSVPPTATTTTCTNANQMEPRKKLKS